MDKTKLIELIDNTVTYHRIPQIVGMPFQEVKPMIEYAIDKLIDSTKEKRDKVWIKALQEVFPQAELTTATDIDIKHCADELLIKYADAWKSLAKK